MFIINIYVINTNVESVLATVVKPFTGTLLTFLIWQVTWYGLRVRIETHYPINFIITAGRTLICCILNKAV